MKFTFQIENGMTFTEEFDTPADFIVGQLDDYDVLPDSGKVIEVLVNGEKLDFEGTVLDLYNLYA